MKPNPFETVECATLSVFLGKWNREKEKHLDIHAVYQGLAQYRYRNIFLRITAFLLLLLITSITVTFFLGQIVYVRGHEQPFMISLITTVFLAVISAASVLHTFTEVNPKKEIRTFAEKWKSIVKSMKKLEVLSVMDKILEEEGGYVEPEPGFNSDQTLVFETILSLLAQRAKKIEVIEAQMRENFLRGIESEELLKEKDSIRFEMTQLGNIASSFGFDLPWNMFFSATK